MVENGRITSGIVCLVTVYIIVTGNTYYKYYEEDIIWNLQYSPARVFVPHP